MFDRIEIIVKAGSGGDGAISFRREKFVPFGGPDGGDGGDGGDTVVKAEPAITNLRGFVRKRIYQAVDGKPGAGKKKHGKKGEDLILRVPVGTVVLAGTNQIGETLLADLGQPGQWVQVAKGGKGGWGNTHYTSSTNQAPQIAQKGEAGEERSIILELRLIADVGIIGYPNAGKSTLLAAASAAKPKIASYPFTTIEPVLGVVELEEQSFVLAEIPGLIDGAHLGRGLGHDFLRHAIRTRILIHLIDGTSVSPVEGWLRVNTELSLFDPALAQKPQLVVVNKVDLPTVRAKLAEIKEVFREAGISVRFVSAAEGEGVTELMTEAMQMLLQATAKAGIGRQELPIIFRPQPKSVSSQVCKAGDAFVVTSPALERIVARVGSISPEMRGQLQRQMVRLGLVKALGKAGIKPGDKVRCGNFEWEW